MPAGGHLTDGDLAAKGDLISASAAGVREVLSVGTDGQVLVADSGEASGLNYADPASLLNPFYPPDDDGSAQTACALHAGTGAPSNANGSNGDYYFRSDGGTGTHIYYKSAGAWAGIV